MKSYEGFYNMRFDGGAQCVVLVMPVGDGIWQELRLNPETAARLGDDLINLVRDAERG